MVLAPGGLDAGQGALRRAVAAALVVVAVVLFAAVEDDGVAGRTRWRRRPPRLDDLLEGIQVVVQVHHGLYLYS